MNSKRPFSFRKKFSQLEKILCILCLIFFLAFTYIFHRENYAGILAYKFNLTDNPPKTDWTLFSWRTSLAKLNYKADIVFFGDSITRGSNFHLAFPQYKIVNLGNSGDSLNDMCSRTDMIQSVKPNKIFILGGVNNLKFTSEKDFILQYDKLVKKVRDENPRSKIYIQSILPISKDAEKLLQKNSRIITYNKLLRQYAQKENIPYLDLHSLYYENGELPKHLTKDGVHLYPEAYARWETLLKKYI